MDKNKVIFCNIAWMKEYAGVSEEDIPKNGGKFVKNNKFGCESLNFFIYNKFCYGYVKVPGKKMSIERIDNEAEGKASVQGVTVIWVASDGKSEKIVGWYENAIAYREQKFINDEYLEFHDNDRNWLPYNFKAEYGDCYLIREEKRQYIIERASKAGKGKGLGQSNIWYADSEDAKVKIIPDVLEYIERIKETDTVKLFNESDYEDNIPEGTCYDGLSLEKLLKQSEDSKLPYDERLYYAKVALDKEESKRTLKNIGMIYSRLLFYDKAEGYFNKVLLLDENDVDALDELVHIYRIKKNNKKVIELGEKVLLLAGETDNVRLRYSLSDLIDAYIENEIHYRAKQLIDIFKSKKYEDSEDLINEWESSIK